VFDTFGSKVATLINNQNQVSGTYKIIFDASNLSSGIYFYTLTTENYKDTQRMVVIK